ncbi:DUF47 domain-containing protein [Candidatus Hecatella orcuttiae]|jgi:hypothetical protein|uniref:DUF47 domain-containing protein n=1 Tax=Candidatus Hecatella orcuttiae TaxID=1935119 RepID=UPI0028680335|nr:DUF47 family protein [Candidatus Hecatella orcuttiae]
MSRFKSTSSIIWLGRERDKKILELCKTHLKKILQVVEEMHKAFEAFHKLDRKGVDKCFNEVFEREKEADEIKRAILEELSKGLFHPINRDEIIRLTMTSDDIAAYAKAAARKLNFISPENLTPNLREILKIFADNLLKITGDVNAAFEALTKKTNLAIQMSQRVENLEERIDDFRVESVVPEFLSWCNDWKAVGQCLLLKEIIDEMENVADRCEDVADVIRDIALSSG